MPLAGVRLIAGGIPQNTGGQSRCPISRRSTL
jgi:hypothetical protein